MSRAYLSRWSGPVDEADDPYHDWPDGPSPGGPAQYYVRESLTFDTDAEMKAALMTYGALYIQFYWNSGSYRSGDSTYYYGGTEDPNHAVTVVGWDDTKATAAATPGAWLVKNSWGTDWGEAGYFWLSYADSIGGNFGISFCDAVAPESFKQVHYYDEFGDVTEFDSPYAMNAFTAGANESLGAIQFWTQADGAGYDLKIYDTFSDGTLSNLLAEVSGTEAFAGYHTVDLPSSLPLAGGDTFYVCLHITDGGSYPQACDRSESHYTSTCTAQPGQSYYSPDGTTWTDLTTWDATANFAIKALTVDRSVPGRTRVSLAPGEVLTGIDFGNQQVNHAPQADSGGPYLAGIGTEVRLDAGGSTDPDAPRGDAITWYEWDFDQDGQYEAQTASPIFVVPAEKTILLGAGSHEIGLRVTDSHGLTGTDTAALDIRGGSLPGTDGNDRVRIALDPLQTDRANVFAAPARTRPTRWSCRTLPSGSSTPGQATTSLSSISPKGTRCPKTACWD